MGFAISGIMIKFGYAELTPIGILVVKNIIVNIFLSGLLSAGTTWGIHQLIEALGRSNSES